MGTAFKKKRIRILYLEDNEHDQVFVRETLVSEGMDCEMQFARNRNEYENALAERKFDLIISDYSLPSFDGLNALAVARRVAPRTPFIFFSGTIGEELAVESLKNGAVDYVLKQRPGRLIPAIRSALRNSAERLRLERAEHALKESEERFRIVARASNDVIWDWDIRTGKLWLSDNFRMAFGHPLSTVNTIAQWQSLIHPDDRDRVVSSLANLVVSHGSVWWSEYRVCRADGSQAHVFDRASIVHDADQKPARVVGVLIDVTERKQWEEKLREQAALLDKARDAIISCDMDSRITYWNQGAERLYGWTTGEAVGKHVHDLLFAPDTQGSLAEAARTADQKGEWSGELAQRTRDGRCVTVQARLTLIRDEQERPKSLLMINTDVTERKQLEEQFLRTQRLESLGVMVSGIAHDLNNALAPVLMGIHILRAQAASPESDKVLQMIETSARRGADMVKQVLTFARGGESRKAMVNLDVLVREMSRIIADVFPRNIKCRVQSGPGPWQVAGIATQLHQVLMNLCVNARDAMPQGGTLSISLSHAHLDTPQLTPHAPGCLPGDYVCVSIADTGVGIPQELLDKVFEPFFTTKEPNQGTGLGLSTSRNIVRNHGGFITVHSEVGRGSVFRIHLPLPRPEKTNGLSTEPRQLPAGNGECVLVIDDEEVVLAIMRSTLENYGYNVLTAPGGAEAVACLAQRGADVDVVITDLVMPFMDGHDTVMALRKIVPGIPVITVSGFGDSDAIDPRRLVDADAFIQKPFTAETLLYTLNEVLERKARGKTGALRKRTGASKRLKTSRHHRR